MASSDTTKISASEWLAVRDRVKGVVRDAVSGNTQDTTILRITEALLAKGYVDIDAITGEIAEEQRLREEREAERLARLEADQKKIKEEGF